MGVQDHVPETLRTARAFRLLSAGQALSVVGDRITPVAIAFAVLGIGDVTDLGIVLAAGGIPFALFAIAGGVVSDRVGRRRVMIASDLVRTVSQAVTAGLLISGRAEVWMLVVLSAVYGTASAVFMPALMGLIPQTVPAGRLQEANAVLGFTRSVASVLGPALAGVIIAVAGPGEAIALDAVTFALSAACLIALRPAASDPGVEPEARFRARLRAGWREVRARPWLRWGLVAMATYHVCVLPAVFALGPALAKAELSGASSWAAIVTAFAVGSIIGSALGLRANPKRPMRVCAAAFLGAACQPAIIAGAGSTLAIGAFEALAGICVAFGFTLWETTLGREIPAHLLSRVTSFDWFSSVGLMPLGYALVGPLADALGLHTVMFGASAIVAALAAAYLVAGPT